MTAALLFGLSLLVQAAPAPSVFSSSRPDDLWAPDIAFPDAAKIDVVSLADGRSRVVGRPGAIPGGAVPVVVLSPNTGSAARTTAAADGSFRAKVVAPPCSWLVVKYDPTGAFGAGEQWLPPFGTTIDALPEDRANAAPSAWVMAPCRPPKAGPGQIPFVIDDEVLPGNLDFSLAGAMSGPFAAGSTVTLSGVITVYAKPGAAHGLEGRRVGFTGELQRRFDAEGRPLMAVSAFFSDVLTPTGLPIEHPGFQPPYQPLWTTGPLRRQGRSGRFLADFRFSVLVPKGAKPGRYSVWLGPVNDDSLKGSLGGPRGLRHFFPSWGLQPSPLFRVGYAKPPRLFWTLLTDVPSAEGTRGTAAEQDVSRLQLLTHIATQSPLYIVPKDSKLTGQPLAYRLEPYLPMVANGDRLVPYPPNVAFRLPSGSLTVEVTRPDGKVDRLGPAPFRTARSRAPTTSRGLLLDNGGSNLTSVLQLSAGTDAFVYRFPVYGRYRVRMTGRIADIYGNLYEGGGDYSVYVARPLNLQPATIPMTPFEAGDAFDPGVAVLPGVPADVSVSVTLLPGSDPAKAVRLLAQGRANRFGLFAPKPGAAPMRLAAPGEFVVETTARYTDADGALWMGASRWGQVVATPGAPIVAHGRRGRDDPRIPLEDKRLWYRFPATHKSPWHMQFPYASGDVLWDTVDDSAMLSLTVQDREGSIEREVRRWYDKGGYYRLSYLRDYDFEDRLRSQEIPLTLATRGGEMPGQDPADVAVWGYWYGGVERPGIRVREDVTDDRGISGRGYWLFHELYELQPGIGSEGDRPGDFKFLFGGTVFREPARGLARYGLYGSLMVLASTNDVRGSRVFPPFEGANGGPSGGPLFTLDGRDVEAFVMPLAARPGSIYETGERFSLGLQLAPTLPGRVEASVEGPGGFHRAIAGRANAVGYFYDPAQDFALPRPGRYRVSVRAVFDAPTSAGAMAPPYPTGTVLGAKDEAFDVYVVDSDSPRLDVERPAWSAVRGLGPVPLNVSWPARAGAKSLDYTVAMPGFLLDEGSLHPREGSAAIEYDPVALARRFPNIDTDRDRAGGPAGLVDTVWVSALLEDGSGRYRARQFTLEGPDLYAP